MFLKRQSLIETQALRLQLFSSKKQLSIDKISMYVRLLISS